jgi:hypothetical protein
MASLRKRGRTWYYRYVDADGVQHEHKGCPDRRATEAMAASAEAEAARVRTGLSDPKAESLRRHGSSTMAEHLADWHASLTAKGNTAKHATLFFDRTRRIAALVHGGSLDEIDSPKAATVAERKQVTQRVNKLMLAYVAQLVAVFSRNDGPTLVFLGFFVVEMAS